MITVVFQLRAAAAAPPVEDCLQLILQATQQMWAQGTFAGLAPHLSPKPFHVVCCMLRWTPPTPAIASKAGVCVGGCLPFLSLTMLCKDLQFLLQHATTHPFLEAVQSGTVKPEQFNTWLMQARALRAVRPRWRRALVSGRHRASAWHSRSCMQRRRTS